MFKGTKVRCDFAVESALPMEEIIEQAETRANQIIAQNREVTFKEVRLEEASRLCSLHRLPEGAGKIRLVSLGEDVVTPCSGIHAKNTPEIGRLRIRTFNFVKPGAIRLTFVVE
ncbi:hypothetical protein HY768_07340 [candidate division TA06 bacterium]|uniref:Threonyl/alanyl tRNA synthetase SAD domain-containing protein n=1 Tax=candidate division TA06 bacterium TaxID=2250710 RepID=A0A933MIE7_UNCT6|nr:hypothetical protein [candidate division TA06 bacterium]